MLIPHIFNNYYAKNNITTFNLSLDTAEPSTEATLLSANNS